MLLRLKNIISTLINKNQATYVNNRFITETAILYLMFSELLFTSDIDRLLMTVDIARSL